MGKGSHGPVRAGAAHSSGCAVLGRGWPAFIQHNLTRFGASLTFSVLSKDYWLYVQNAILKMILPMCCIKQLVSLYTRKFLNQEVVLVKLACFVSVA